MAWIDNVRRNIFPLSKEKNSLRVALNEWYFVNMEDNIDANLDCQLCNHYPIRYKFIISNSITNKEMYVGSECILRFEEEGYSLKDENGDFVSNDTLQNAKNKALKKVLLNYLQSLNSIDNSIVLDVVENDKRISPKMIPFFYHPYKEADDNLKKIMRKYLKVNLRRKKYKDQLLNFIDENNWRVSFIKKFMTAEQIKKYF